MQGQVKIAPVGGQYAGARIAVGTACEIFIVCKIIDTGKNRIFPPVVAEAQVHDRECRNSAVYGSWCNLGICSIRILFGLVRELISNIETGSTERQTSAKEHRGTFSTNLSAMAVFLVFM